MIKDLKRNTLEANHPWEPREKLEQGLQVQTNRRISGEGQPSSNLDLLIIQGVP